MINKIKNLTESILLTHNIYNLNNDEITINGKDEIQKFLNKLIK